MNEPAHPLQEASGVFAYVCQPADDVVQVEVTEGGVILTLPPHLRKKCVGGGMYDQPIFSCKGVLRENHKHIADLV